MRRIVLVVVVLLLISASFLLVSLDGVRSAFLSARDWIDDLGLWGPVVVALVFAALTPLMVPATFFVVGAGLLFGLWKGFAVAVAGANIGALYAFLLSRRLFRKRAESLRRKYRRFAAFDSAIARKGFPIVFLLRLSMAFPFTVLNVLLGVTAISVPAYVLANALGMLPGTFAYVYIGTVGETAMASGSFGHVALKMVGLVATCAAVALIGRTAWRTARSESSLASGPRRREKRAGKSRGRG